MKYITHTVEEGESLSTISTNYYQTYRHWRSIYSDNIRVIGDDPDLIRVGLELKIRRKPHKNTVSAVKMLKYFKTHCPNRHNVVWKLEDELVSKLKWTLIIVIAIIVSFTLLYY